MIGAPYASALTLHRSSRVSSISVCADGRIGGFSSGSKSDRRFLLSERLGECNNHRPTADTGFLHSDELLPLQKMLGIVHEHHRHHLAHRVRREKLARLMVMDFEMYVYIFSKIGILGELRGTPKEQTALCGRLLVGAHHRQTGDHPEVTHVFGIEGYSMFKGRGRNQSVRQEQTMTETILAH